MKTLFKSWIFRVIALMMVASAAFAQDRGPFQREELDQMLAPVALYPDALLSQILMASTYPLEVVQASRWSRTNPSLKGQNAVRAVERMDWDPSVKSLTAFPQILHMMDEKLEWTERLGEAFLAQQAEVMDTVQDLRRRAEAAGNLSSSDQMQVRREGEFIMIEPPAPEVVYVPYYDPTVVYGPWWWPEYPPVYWALQWAYYVVPPYPSLFVWGSGIGVSANFFFGYPDWPRRHVTVGNRQTPSVNRGAGPREPVVWRHNPDHRRGVPFRHAEARQRFEQERAAAGTTRRGPDRNDVAPTIRRADDTRPADVRQRRLEERRNPVQQQRESAVGRVTPDNDGNRAARAPVNRNDERVRPAAQPEARAAKPETRTARPDTRGSQAETRNPQPDTRGAQSDSRNARPDSRAAPPERSTPQSGDRRGERRDTQRPLARNDPPQPVAVAPVVRSEPRSARSEPRPDMRRAAPQRPPAFDNGRRAEARGGVERGRQQDVVRERAPAPRAAANVPNPAPRTENSQQRGGGARDQGDGNPRGRSVNRDNNRS